MIKILSVLLAVICQRTWAHSLPDLTPEAITVYRNPDFFKNLKYGAKVDYDPKPTKASQDAQENYKYPGETKKPNPPPASPGFEVNYDNSPEFHHEPRDIFVDVTYTPSRRKGPYGPRQRSEEETAEQRSDSKSKDPPRVRENEEEKGQEEEEDESQDSREKIDGRKLEPEPREFVSVLGERPEEEFEGYREPILFARSFEGDRPAGFATSTYSQPYPLNRTSPVLYEDWKFYNYPQIHSKEHLKSGSSRIYSEEPPSTAFEADESLSYGRSDQEEEEEGDTEDAAAPFESGEFKNLGADTKHIYKKLLSPKKSLLFKFHSKPKFKKLKLKLKKKKHLHNADWFDEYPFNF